MRKLLTILTFMIAGSISANVCNTNDEYDDLAASTSWYADHSEEIILRFEGLRHNSGELPQKYAVFPYAQASYPNHALVVSTWDESLMIMYTPNGNHVSGKIVTSSAIPEDTYWTRICDLLSNATASRDITLKQRPLPIRSCDQAHNQFIAVIDHSDAAAIKDINSYNQMIFKPHHNAVRLTGQRPLTKKDEMGQVILDEMQYTFKLQNPAVVSKMFRGYEDGEMAPWVVKNSFFADHRLLQFSRWKNGEPIKEASPDICDIISTYYNGRAVTATRWLATVENGERSFYAVQFAHQNGDALAVVACISEGEVVSTWEFHGSMEPKEYADRESVWFVDDEGEFMEHAPEIQCIVETDNGLELYLMLYGGESVQYYIIREVSSVMMILQVDYWIYVW